MKKTILLALLSGLLFSAYCQSPVDVLHYKFELSISDNTDSITGKASILVRFKQTADSFLLDLASARKDGRGMTALSVHQQDHQLLKFIHSNNTIRIYLPVKKSADDTATFTVFFSGIPADGLIISKNMFGRRTFFSDNWPNRAHNWIPCIDNPADKATLEFLVTAPAHYQVISNGIQIEETSLTGEKKFTHWREDVPLPTKVMVIGVADFAVQHAGFVNNCIPVSSWVFPENMEKGFYDYSIGKDVLAFFDQYIAPYPYRKLANVQSKTIYGGMENAGAIFYYESSVNGYRAEEGLFAHEIVHQWFGDMATEKSFAHLWLSEGFATYLTHIYMEAKYGTDSLNNRMKEDRETVLSYVKESKRSVVDSTPNYKSLLNANSYQKGGWVLHMLRRQLGDSVFHESIRQYYTTFAGGNAETRDLQAVFEKVSGRKLDTFFRQWLYRKENPELLITWKNNPKENSVMITVEQLQGELFELPLDILFLTGLRKNDANQFTISKRKETFTVKLKSPVLQLEADYTTSLLAKITVKEEK